MDIKELEKYVEEVLNEVLGEEEEVDNEDGGMDAWTKIELEHANTIEYIKTHPDISIKEAAAMIRDDHIKELGKKYYPELIEMEKKLKVEKEK